MVNYPMYEVLTTNNKEMERIFHKEDEFNQLDWSKLIEGDFATNGENYGFGVGGRNYPAGEGLNISVLNESGDEEHIWAIPKILNKYFVWAEKNAKEEKASEIRSALGI